MMSKKTNEMKEELMVNVENNIIITVSRQKNVYFFIILQGRIINFSSHKAKNIKYNMNHPDKIIT